jgi:hypothetical protein
MNNDYTFFLYFKTDNVKLQIEEPFMFDAFSHSIERKQDGFSVDVNLFAENTDLMFTNSVYSKSSQYEDIDGTVMFNLSHGLKRIIDSYVEYGPDGEIELSIYYLDKLLTKCDFDLEDVETDQVSYFKCGFIENNIRSKHKIREDDVMIDIYTDKTLDDEPITKLQPVKILMLSKSTFANSKWIKSDIFYKGAPNNSTTKFPAGSSYQYFNFCKTVIEDGIEDTLSPSPLDQSNSFRDTYDGTMKMIDCKTSKKDSKLIVRSDVSFKHVYNGATGYAVKSGLSLNLNVSFGVEPGENYSFVLYKKDFTGTETQEDKVPEVIEFDFPNILNEGEFITLYWYYYWNEATVALDNDYNAIDNYSHVVFNDCTVEMTAVESVINSVIQGVRWIDTLKQSAKIISGLKVDAPRIDYGGEYYDTVICNGGGVRNISNIPFNVKTKDLFEMGKMVAQDYQITEDKILVGEYADFFSNKKLRTFKIKPDEKFYWNTNKNYRIKAFDYKFSNYEQDRQEQRTLDAVHTEEQILMPTKKPVNSKTVEIKQILDSYKIDSLRRLGIDPETEDSSLADDTDLVMLKVAPLSNLHLENYIGLLSVSIVGSGIKIYSTTFRWDKIGLGLNSQFKILTGGNTGTYRITKIEPTILSLTKITGASNISESKIIRIQYSLDNVLFISETDQQFAEVLGVISKDTYTNLIYSKLRNIQKWFPYLATCSMGFPNGIMKISFLKSNQDLSTRLLTESKNLVEKQDIKVSEISELKVVTNKKFSVNIYLNNPIDIIDIFNEMNVRNSDGTIGGYHEFIDNEGNSVFGYPDKFDFIPHENKIEAVCIEKYIVGNRIIDLKNSERNLYSQYESFGIYFTIYKSDYSLFAKQVRFTKIKINGVLYSDLQTFINDLEIFFSY